MSRADEGAGSAALRVEVLVGRFRDGHPLAVQRVRARVSRIVAFRGYGIPREDRHDIEQRVLTELWQAVGRSGFDPSGFWGLVEVVSARRCIDCRRGRRDVLGLDEIGEPSASDPDPLHGFLRRERHLRAQRILARLPASCRELIRLHAGQGKTYREIAGILGESEGALRVRMYRCVQRARQLVREMSADEAPIAAADRENPDSV